MTRNSVNCSSTTPPLASSDTRASRRFFAASRRCTINWSVPCDAIVRNAPPIRPAQKVYVVVRFIAKLNTCSLPAAPVTACTVVHPPLIFDPSVNSATTVPPTYSPICTTSVQMTAAMPPSNV